MTDAETIQLFALVNGRQLSQIARQGSTVNHPEGQPFQMPHFPQPQQQYRQPQIPDFPVPQIPDYLPTTMPTNLVDFPRDAQGKAIIPPEYQHLIPNNNGNAPAPTNGTPTSYTGSFEVPNYGNSPAIPTETQFDLIIKELKSLKKAINKLIKQNENAKLPQTTATLIVDSNDPEIKPD